MASARRHCRAVFHSLSFRGTIPTSPPFRTPIILNPHHNQSVISQKVLAASHSSHFWLNAPFYGMPCITPSTPHPPLVLTYLR